MRIKYLNIKGSYKQTVIHPIHILQPSINPFTKLMRYSILRLAIYVEDMLHFPGFHGVLVCMTAKERELRVEIV